MSTPAASTFDVTFLGTGTSVGVPMIGCECPVCQSTDPHDQRLRASIYVETPEAAWIVDTGPDFRTQCLRAKIKRVDAILLTHPHSDHILGFDDVRRYTVPQDAVMPVYATASCLAAVRRVFDFAFNGENRWIGYLKPEPHEIHGPFQIGETVITPLPVVHGRVETIGFLFSRHGRKLLAYIPDVKEIPDATVALMMDVEVLVIDALRYTDHPTHMSFPETTAMVERVRAPRAWFTHFQCQIGHAAAEALLPPHIRPAYDGLKLSLPLDRAAR